MVTAELKHLVESRKATKEAAERRYGEIVRAFIAGEEPDDTDEILVALGIDLDRFAADIATVKRRQELAEQFAKLPVAVEAAAELDAEAERKRQKFWSVEQAFKKERQEIFNTRQQHYSDIDLARKAESELRATADGALLTQEARLNRELDTVAKSLATADNTLRRLKAVPAKGVQLLGGDYSPGPDVAGISRVTESIRTLDDQKRRLEASLRSVRDKQLVP